MRLGCTIYYYSLALLCTSSARQVHLGVHFSSDVTIYMYHKILYSSTGSSQKTFRLRRQTSTQTTKTKQVLILFYFILCYSMLFYIISYLELQHYILYWLNLGNILTLLKNCRLGHQSLTQSSKLISPCFIFECQNC